nr:MAG: nucleotidyltransferase substrate binding protein, HI0074 family [Candidatus Kentron sp. LFY]
MVVTPVFPRNVIKEAFKTGLIDDGQVWIDMMLDRNRLSHRYNSRIFNEVLHKLSERYFAAFDRLHDFFLNRSVEEWRKSD